MIEDLMIEDLKIWRLDNENTACVTRVFVV